MKRMILLSLFVGCLSALATAQGRPPRNVQLEDLGWLAGSWSGEIRGAGSATRFETHYTTPEGGVILSTSRAFSHSGELRWFEFERFEIRDGVLQLTPYPNGQPSVPFTLVEYDAAAKKAVFANDQHDYPNRLTYQRTAEDKLFFVVAGNSEGEAVMEIRLSRQP